MSLLATYRLRSDIGHLRIGGDLNLAVGQRECWAILGANGAGKTTLLHTLAGLRQPAVGEVVLDGKPLPNWRRQEIAQRLGILLQDSDDPFPATVLETALIGRHPHLGALQWEGADDRERARAALADVGLAGFEQRGVETLSGGERRRLAIATLLTQDPLLLLLDEPTNHLDLHHQIELLTHLTTQVRAREGAIVMALHDVNLAARYCDHLILVFPDGEVLHGPTSTLLNTDNLSCLYRHPIRAIDDNGSTIFLPA